MRSRNKSRFPADRKTWFSALVGGLVLGFSSVALGGKDAELDINISAATLTSDAEELGATTESGALESIFILQKALVYDIIRQAGLDPDKLSPATKAAIDKPQTTNLEAFLAFSHSLDLLDQGRYAEAQLGFQRAATIDPEFEIATHYRDTTPVIQQQAGDIAEASIKEAQQTEATPLSAGSSPGDSEGSGTSPENAPGGSSKAAPKDSPRSFAEGGKDAAAAGPKNVLGGASKAAANDSSGGKGPAVASPKEVAADGVTTEPLTESSSEPLAESSSEPLTESSSEPLAESSSEPLSESPPPEPLAESPPPEPLTESPPPEPLTESPPPEPLTAEPLTESPPPEPLTESPAPEPLTESPPLP